MLNPTNLGCITCYTIEGAIGDSNFNKMSHKMMDLIDSYTSIYLSIIKSTEHPDMTNKEKKLAEVLGDIESYRLG